MKNIFKKNHIIITALAIMIVIAGYLSFTNKDTPEDTDAVVAANPDTDDYDEFTEVNGLEVVTDTTGTDDTATDDTTGTDDTATDDTTGTDNTDAADDTDVNATDTDELGENDISDEDVLASAQDVTDKGELNIEDGVPGEAVLANTTIDASYFISSKLDREQVRAKNRDTLMDIIGSTEITGEEKQAAIDSMIELTEISEKEGAAEVLLEGKGFDGAIVYIVDDQANVVVNASNLTEQQLAIIEDVVKGQTGIPVEKIHINTVVVEE
jgi:stage III sporulation protein AH